MSESLSRAFRKGCNCSSYYVPDGGQFTLSLNDWRHAPYAYDRILFVVTHRVPLSLIVMNIVVASC
jgi:hypothetical protein